MPLFLEKKIAILKDVLAKDGAPSITHYEVIDEKEINNIKISKVKMYFRNRKNPSNSCAYVLYFSSTFRR